MTNIGLSLLLMLLTTQVIAAPQIVIIIDDLGNQSHTAKRVMDLPGPVVCSILPQRPFTKKIARWAHEQQKEVLVHLPMQSIQNSALGPGGLELSMDEHQFRQTIIENLDSVPFNIGLNNHMGSLMTQHPGNMMWLMQTLKTYPDKVFLDSRTTHKTVAHDIAIEFDIPSVSRDIFLDDLVEIEAIQSQFDLLIEIAKKKGQAIAIGHPYPETLEVLNENIPLLSAQGVELVSLKTLMQGNGLDSEMDISIAAGMSE